jgi:outer membrane protein assembly factor BamE (lipoprotein component of BamABCDE complex)
VRWLRKNVLLVLLAVAAVFAIELWRERVVYRRGSSALEQGSRRLRRGMSREEVKQIMGEPHGASSGEPDESWHWSAYRYQGALWGLLGLNTAKGHYGVSVTFGQGGVVNVSEGVN